MGWGIQKDHKGKGMQGGAGNAGTDSHRWIQTIKLAKLNRTVKTGKFGFKRPQQYLKPYNTINVSHLNESIDKLVEKEKATLEGKKYKINLSEIGIKKLLAQGDVTKAIEVTVDMATERAISKIEAAGGKVILQNK